jgi:hypothetical protein
MWARFEISRSCALPFNLDEKKAKYNSNFFWSWRLDLNQRPADYKSAALPTELRQHLERETGLEPATYSLEGCRSTN